MHPSIRPQESSAFLTLRLLGPFQAQIGDAPLPHSLARKERWLLALLALRAGRETERAWLAGLLWPESAEENALLYLRMSLTRLRRALSHEAGRILSPTRHTLALNVTGADIDLLAFDQWVAQGDPLSLERAVRVYRGPLLEGCMEDWVYPERSARERACLAALGSLAFHARTKGDFPRSIDLLRRAIRIDPISEGAYRALIEVYAAAGDGASVTRVYRELRALLLREMTTEPSRETQALFERIQAERGLADAKPRSSSTGRKRTWPLLPLSDDQREWITLLDAQAVTREAVEMYLYRSLFWPDSPLLPNIEEMDREAGIRFLMNSIAPEYIHLFIVAFQAEGEALTQVVLAWAEERAKALEPVH